MAAFQKNLIARIPVCAVARSDKMGGGSDILAQPRALMPADAPSIAYA